MGLCGLCGTESVTVSSRLGLCVDCIRNDYERAALLVAQTRERLRESFGLPPRPPDTDGGILCRFCGNGCRIGESEHGFCGAWQNRNGKLKSSFPNRTSAVSFYHDSLPTNCVADWVCPARTEYGYKNLAVFYQSCNFDCLFCQNWHFRDRATHTHKEPKEVADAADERTACICYFGGDPTPTIRHSLEVAKIARRNNPDRPLRICWETNGGVNRLFLKKMVDVALASGGCIKFDLKFASDELSRILCGVSNRTVFENFRFVASYIDKRPHSPLLVASTLLVPGYVDDRELRELAAFISTAHRNIPWALLGFHPDYHLTDLPRTSRRDADVALRIAEEYGIKNVRVGNIHLLGSDY